MAFIFRGFFTSPAERLIEAAVKRWPGASVRPIHEHFEGIGVRLPEPDPDDPQQYMMVVNCEHELPEWSKQFPENTFVYIMAECFGGLCDYFGYAYKNGRTFDVVDEEQEGALTRLLSHLGASLGNQFSSEYFRPFDRNYRW